MAPEAQDSTGHQSPTVYASKQQGRSGTESSSISGRCKTAQDAKSSVTCSASLEQIAPTTAAEVIDPVIPKLHAQSSSQLSSFEPTPTGTPQDLRVSGRKQEAYALSCF